MRTFTHISSIVVALLIGMSARAEGQDGSFFLQACGPAVRISDGEDVKPEEMMGSVFCTAYVSGFLDSMSVASGVMKTAKPVCLPEKGITNDQAVRIFVKYLRQNPEVLNQSGRMSLMISLRSAFPCAK